MICGVPLEFHLLQLRQRLGAVGQPGPRHHVLEPFSAPCPDRGIAVITGAVSAVATIITGRRSRVAPGQAPLHGGLTHHPIAPPTASHCRRPSPAARCRARPASDRRAARPVRRSRWPPRPAACSSSHQGVRAGVSSDDFKPEQQAQRRKHDALGRRRRDPQQPVDDRQRRPAPTAHRARRTSVR